MDIHISREWAISNSHAPPRSFRATAKAEELHGIKLFDAIKDVSNVRASSIELTVTRNPGKGAFCYMTLLLKPQ